MIAIKKSNKTAHILRLQFAINMILTKLKKATVWEWMLRSKILRPNFFMVIKTENLTKPDLT